VFPKAFQLIGAFLAALPKERGGYVPKKSEARDLLAGRQPSRRWRNHPEMPRPERRKVTELRTAELSAIAEDILARFGETLGSLLLIPDAATLLAKAIEDWVRLWDELVADLPPSADGKLRKDYVWSQSRKRLVPRKRGDTISDEGAELLRESTFHRLVLDIALRAGAHGALSRSKMVRPYWAQPDGTSKLLSELVPSLRQSQEVKTEMSEAPGTWSPWLRGVTPSARSMLKFARVVARASVLKPEEIERKLLLHYALKNVMRLFARSLSPRQVDDLADDWSALAHLAAVRLTDKPTLARSVFELGIQASESGDETILGILIAVAERKGPLRGAAIGRISGLRAVEANPPRGEHR
jgi:hypothetical protein